MLESNSAVGTNSSIQSNILNIKSEKEPIISSGEITASQLLQTENSIVNNLSIVPDTNESEDRQTQSNSAPVLVTDEVPSALGENQVQVLDAGSLLSNGVVNDITGASSVLNGDGTQQVLLNTGNAYQTVTIVPSSTENGEISYVLIVQQPEDAADPNADGDLSVYEFNEGEEGIRIVSNDLNTCTFY